MEAFSIRVTVSLPVICLYSTVLVLGPCAGLQYGCVDLSPPFIPWNCGRGGVVGGSQFRKSAAVVGALAVRRRRRLVPRNELQLCDVCGAVLCLVDRRTDGPPSVVSYEPAAAESCPTRPRPAVSPPAAIYRP